MQRPPCKRQLAQAEYEKASLSATIRSGGRSTSTAPTVLSPSRLVLEFALDQHHRTTALLQLYLQSCHPLKLLTRRRNMTMKLRRGEHPCSPLQVSRVRGMLLRSVCGHTRLDFVSVSSRELHCTIFAKYALQCNEFQMCYSPRMPH